MTTPLRTLVLASLLALAAVARAASEPAPAAPAARGEAAAPGDASTDLAVLADAVAADLRTLATELEGELEGEKLRARARNVEAGLRQDLAALREKVRRLRGEPAPAPAPERAEPAAPPAR
jgi:hypothetical protein